MPEPPDSDLAKLVRKGDRDRYLSTLFAPAKSRPALLALYAFNVELARIGETVSEPILGEIRLQWWRDALSGATSSGHPVADALRTVIAAHELPVTQITEMIDARIFDVTGGTMPDMLALKTYLNKTAGAVFALAAAILGGRPTVSNAVTGPAALAYGLTGLMRSLPLQHAKEQIYLPVAGLASHGVADQATSDTMRQALGDVRRQAVRALSEARHALRDTPKSVLPAFLPLAVVGPYLEVLARPSFDPLREIADISPLRRLWAITAAAARGQI